MIGSSLITFAIWASVPEADPDMRVFDLMNMQGLNAVRVEEVIICLYKWLNPNTAIDEAIYNGMMSQPFLYTPWRKEHKDLAAIKVGDLVLTPVST